MLIMVVKDVGKLPYSRANTHTQWYSSQPNAAPVRMKHPSDDKPVRMQEQRHCIFIHTLFHRASNVTLVNK